MLFWCRWRAEFTALRDALDPLRRGEEARLTALDTQPIFCAAAAARCARWRSRKPTADPGNGPPARRPELSRMRAERQDAQNSAPSSTRSCDCIESVTPRFSKANILRPGGLLAFTCPFYHHLAGNLLRARMEGGEVQHILPPVYHGDRLGRRGALVYTHPGWETFDILSAVGFEEAYVVMMYDLVEGIVTNGCPFDDGHVWPVVLVGRKPGIA